MAAKKTGIRKKVKTKKSKKGTEEVEKEYTVEENLCLVCKSKIASNSKFCSECGAIQTEEKTFKIVQEEIKENESKDEYEINLRNEIDELVKIKEARIGIILIICGLIIMAMISYLPIVHVTSNTDNYTAYYDNFFEKTTGSDPEAPREMISDNALEEVFEGHLTLIQTSSWILILIGILVASIGYLGWAEKDILTYELRNIILYRIIQMATFVLMASAFTFIGLTFEMFIYDLAVIPIISIYIFIIFVFILKKISSLKDNISKLRDKKLEESHHQLGEVFDFVGMALISISFFPWSVGTSDGIPYRMITHAALEAANSSTGIQIREMEIMLETINMMEVALWLILVASLIGFIGLRICDSYEGDGFLSNFMLLTSNSINILNLILLYSVYSFIMTISDYEIYYNSVIATPEEQANFYYFCNYFPLLSGIIIMFTAFKYSKNTLRRSIDKIVPDK